MRFSLISSHPHQSLSQYIYAQASAGICSHDYELSLYERFISFSLSLLLFSGTGERIILILLSSSCNSSLIPLP